MKKKKSSQLTRTDGFIWPLPLVFLAVLRNCIASNATQYEIIKTSLPFNSQGLRQRVWTKKNNQKQPENIQKTMKTAPEFLELEVSEWNVLSKINRNPNKPRCCKNKSEKEIAHACEKRRNKPPLSYHTCPNLSPFPLPLILSFPCVGGVGSLCRAAICLRSKCWKCYSTSSLAIMTARSIGSASTTPRSRFSFQILEDYRRHPLLTILRLCSAQLKRNTTHFLQAWGSDTK